MPTQLNAVSASLKKPLLVAFLLAVLTFTLFSPAFRYDFVNYDDDIYVYENAHTLSGLNIPGIEYAFTSTAGGSWMPLTWISYMLDGSVWGNQSAGFHFTNVLLHSLAVAFLFLASMRLTKRFGASLFVAALFAVHPLRVESVVWVAERKDVLNALFWMLGLLAYVRYVEKPNTARYSWVFLCLLLGLMSKPMAVTFPIVLLLLDHWPLKRFGGNPTEFRANTWPLLREKIPLLLLCAAVAALTIITQNSEGAVNAIHAPLQMKLLRVADNYGFYARKFFWPSQLAILYPPGKVVLWRASVCAVLMAGMIGLSLRWLFRFPWLAVGVFWFITTLLPVIGLIHVGHITVADRYSYIPSVGLALVIAGAFGVIAGRAQLRPVITVLAAIAVLAAAVATWANLPRWQNSLTLLEDSLKKGPHEVAYNNLAVYYKAHGQVDASIEACDKAIDLYPDYAEAFNNRGLAREDKHDYAAALADFDRAIQLQPDSAVNHNNRGSAFLHSGDTQHAMEDFNTAIKLKPDYATAYSNRGGAWADLGNFDTAIKDCIEAIKYNPGLADAWNNLGNFYSRLGDLNRAIDDYSEAIKLKPAEALYYNNRGAGFFMLKRYTEAKADLETCRSLGGQPNPALVHDLDEAIKSANK